MMGIATIAPSAAKASLEDRLIVKVGIVQTRPLSHHALELS